MDHKFKQKNSSEFYHLDHNMQRAQENSVVVMDKRLTEEAEKEAAASVAALSRPLSPELELMFSLSISFSSSSLLILLLTFSLLLMLLLFSASVMSTMTFGRMVVACVVVVAVNE